MANTGPYEPCWVPDKRTRQTRPGYVELAHKLERYEAALREIAEPDEAKNSPYAPAVMMRIAREALDEA